MGSLGSRLAAGGAEENLEPPPILKACGHLVINSCFREQPRVTRRLSLLPLAVPSGVASWSVAWQTSFDPSRGSSWWHLPPAPSVPRRQHQQQLACDSVTSSSSSELPVPVPAAAGGALASGARPGATAAPLGSRGQCPQLCH